MATLLWSPSFKCNNTHQRWRMSSISSLKGLPSWKIAACKLSRVSGAVNSHTGCTCRRLWGCSIFTGLINSLKALPPLSPAILKSTTSVMLLGLIPGQRNRLADGNRVSCLSNSPALFNTHSFGRKYGNDTNLYLPRDYGPSFLSLGSCTPHISTCYCNLPLSLSFKGVSQL